MKNKPRLRHTPDTTYQEWYMYVDAKVEGTDKTVRINGFGRTPEAALRSLQEGVDYRNAYLHRLGLRIEVQLPYLPRIPKPLIATSNLPWWRRLFRVWKLQNPLNQK